MVEITTDNIVEIAKGLSGGLDFPYARAVGQYNSDENSFRLFLDRDHQSFDGVDPAIADAAAAELANKLKTMGIECSVNQDGMVEIPRGDNERTIQSAVIGMGLQIGQSRPAFFDPRTPEEMPDDKKLKRFTDIINAYLGYSKDILKTEISLVPSNDLSTSRELVFFTNPVGEEEKVAKYLTRTDVPAREHRGTVVVGVTHGRDYKKEPAFSVLTGQVENLSAKYNNEALQIKGKQIEYDISTAEKIYFSGDSAAAYNLLLNSIIEKSTKPDRNLKSQFRSQVVEDKQGAGRLYFEAVTGQVGNIKSPRLTDSLALLIAHAGLSKSVQLYEDIIPGQEVKYNNKFEIIDKPETFEALLAFANQEAVIIQKIYEKGEMIASVNARNISSLPDDTYVKENKEDAKPIIASEEVNKLMKKWPKANEKGIVSPPQELFDKLGEIIKDMPLNNGAVASLEDKPGTRKSFVATLAKDRSAKLDELYKPVGQRSAVISF